jgi:hypothetical protein
MNLTVLGATGPPALSWSSRRSPPATTSRHLPGRRRSSPSPTPTSTSSKATQPTARRSPRP